jgi:hypothetical protein
MTLSQLRPTAPRWSPWRHLASWLVTAWWTSSAVALAAGASFFWQASAAPMAKPVDVALHAATSAGSRRVVLYGDSLSSQAQRFFIDALAQAGITEVTSRTYGGTAICDWLPQMRSDADRLRPDAVVVQFSGNDLTPCMRGPDGKQLQGATYYRTYEADTFQVLKIFGPHHTLVFFAGSPIDRQADAGSLLLNTIYEAVAQFNPYGRYVDAGASVLLDGHWTETLPCLPNEPCTGGRDANGTPVNVVRAPDGAHFCPGAPNAVHGVTTVCPVWSSGAWRFGNAMTKPVIAELSTDRAAIVTVLSRRRP